ncbi:amino acid deaminase/aldolase [Aureispira anguillae]|uniref:Amino acid deaminase/aldolase n=1 Tax=Aureispira anguillae TaxID=2864201 RepID=A0A915YH87_9BACT|nr:amino acid deaminase/aldolase [Aureispira anguillae]BDS13145.1 amino acid deaminase/aldolase [Aureispira anguillae]
MEERTYSYYKAVFEGEEKPFAYIDLDFFDQNIKDILERAKDKKIRIASKSIRCVSLMRRILEYSPQYQGIMCYSALEAVWLSELGFDDLLVAYPTFHPKHIEQVGQAVKKGKKIYLMTDKIEHLKQINQVGAQLKVKIPICMDVDMSSTFPGIYFGVYRSSLNTIEAVEQYLDHLSDFPFVDLRGIMGYEAQIAGVGNNVEGQGVKNTVIRMLQKRSIREIRTRRTAIVELTKERVGALDFVNGGGTGSIEITRREELVTEIAAGSGFYMPTLFDSYEHFRHLPSAGYAIEIVRQPKAHVYTCLGGGYVASGPLNINKLPQPYLPKGCELYPNEMAGEVQTPIYYKGNLSLKLGDPIFFRHSKAGELCERFNELLLVQDGKIIEKTTTYRGDGQCFL